MRKSNIVLANAALGALLVAVSTSAGCSEANDDTDAGYNPPEAGQDARDGGGPATDTGGAGKDSGSPPQDGGTAADHVESETAPPPADAGAPGLVINEVCGKTQDFVELFNTGTESVDLSDWGVTEAKDDDAGAPGKQKTAALFASGDKLGPGEYAVVYGEPSDGGTIPACPATVCINATWNVSNKSGASAYLLDPSGGTVATAPYPKDMVGTGQSWGRLPNGSGTFQLNTATPGKANLGP